mmetsp:Transcript_7040/g.22212  ORF Transcript_7040/g.22212 Transcript_7040/m.22212 type:complete len:233 (+) Transcript_7040:1801-2499(+)
MHVAVAVRLGLEEEGAVGAREARRVVHERGHLLLLHQRDLLLSQPEEVVLAQEGRRALVRVVRRHDGERDGAVGAAGARLECENVLGVPLHERLATHQIHRQRDLDAIVPEPLAQPARHEHEAGLADMLHPDGLKREELGRARLHARARRHLGRPPLEWGFALLGVGEERFGVLVVGAQPAGVRLLQRGELREERAFLVVTRARRRPAVEHVRLAKRDKQAGEAHLLGTQER